MAFWWGSFVGACRDDSSCAARWDGVGAVGTWVGGLGTIAAVLIAARAFQGEERARRREARRAAMSQTQRELEDRKEAELVRLETMVGGYNHEYINQMRFTVRNESNETPAFKVRIRYDPWGIDALIEHKLEAGKVTQYSVDFGGSSGRSSIAMTPAEHAIWARSILIDARLFFEMNDRQWMRIGEGVPMLAIP